MPSTVKILRSTTPGAQPSSLSSGEIAINEADGKLFYRTAAGAVSAFTSGGGGSSSLVVCASVSAFPATGSESVLYLSESTSKLFQWESGVYVEVGGSGGGGDAVDSIHPFLLMGG